MFTMDDWMGLTILMFGIALLIALIANVAIQMWRASRALLVIWRASRNVRAMPMPVAKCMICGMLKFDGESCGCKPIFVGSHTPPLRNPGPPVMIGIDMGAGDDITTRKFSEAEVCVAFGVDPRPLELNSIIRDLRETIVLEHLEVRSSTRFNNILKRLEAYRDPNLPLPPQ